MESIVEFKNVKKSFGRKIVLDNLSFRISAGNFIGLIGNNGCGKTTAINILCNLMDYDSGEVSVFSRVVNREYVSYKKNLGIVLSKPYYIEDFTPIEHLSFIARFQGISKKLIPQRINDMLVFFDLKKNSSELIKNLSSGNKMKINIASALIHSPDILILDEPFVNLDIQTSENILKTLENLKGIKSLFITSHNLDLIANLCDSFLIMEQGKIINNFRKSDFSSMELLKDEIKNILSEKIKLSPSIPWLSDRG